MHPCVEGFFHTPACPEKNPANCLRVRPRFHFRKVVDHSDKMSTWPCDGMQVSQFLEGFQAPAKYTSANIDESAELPFPRGKRTVVFHKAFLSTRLPFFPMEIYKRKTVAPFWGFLPCPCLDHDEPPCPVCFQVGITFIPNSPRWLVLRSVQTASLLQAGGWRMPKAE